MDDEYKVLCKCGHRAVDHSLCFWLYYQFDGMTPVGSCGLCECHQFEGEGLGPHLCQMSDRGQLTTVQYQIGDETIQGYILDKGGDPEELKDELLDRALREPIEGWSIEYPKPIQAEIILPEGALGRMSEDDLLEAGLRAIAEEAAKLTPEDWNMSWPGKYGINYENDVFMMHRYCWCEKEDCPWCYHGAPNFVHHASGLEVNWYKYIGRSMEISEALGALEIATIIKECLESLT